jgi:hypothetical protein
LGSHKFSQLLPVLKQALAWLLLGMVRHREERYLVAHLVGLVQAVVVVILVSWHLPLYQQVNEAILDLFASQC